MVAGEGVSRIPQTAYFSYARRPFFSGANFLENAVKRKFNFVEFSFPEGG